MEENLNIFGKNQGEIGSLDKNLVLRTKGRVYIRYGKKYIELLDDKGNINVKIPKVLTKVDSEEEIKNSGFYLLDENLYAYYDGELIQITGVEGQFISYAIKQNLSQEQIDIAQKNIGLKFKTINDATKIISEGIVFVGSDIYYVNGNSYTKLTLNSPLKEINNAGLEDFPSEDNSCIAYINGEWIYAPLLTKRDLNNLKLEILEELNEEELDEEEEEFDSIFDPIQYSKVYTIRSGNSSDSGIIDLKTSPAFDQKEGDIAIFSINVIKAKSISTQTNSNGNQVTAVVADCEIKKGEIIIDDEGNIVTYSDGSPIYEEAIVYNEDIKTFNLKVQDNETLLYINEEGNTYTLEVKEGYMFYNESEFEDGADSIADGKEVDYATIEGTTWIFNNGFTKSLKNKHLYIKAEQSKKEKFKIDYAHAEIALEENYPEDEETNKPKIIPHAVLGDLDDKSEYYNSPAKSFRTYKEKENSQGLFSDQAVFVGTEFRQPLNYKELEEEKEYTDVEVYNFPRYSKTLDEILCTKHQEIEDGDDFNDVIPTIRWIKNNSVKLNEPLNEINKIDSTHLEAETVEEKKIHIIEEINEEHSYVILSKPDGTWGFFNLGKWVNILNQLFQPGYYWSPDSDHKTYTFIGINYDNFQISPTQPYLWYSNDGKLWYLIDKYINPSSNKYYILSTEIQYKDKIPYLSGFFAYSSNGKDKEIGYGKSNYIETLDSAHHISELYPKYIQILSKMTNITKGNIPKVNGYYYVWSIEEGQDITNPKNWTLETNFSKNYLQVYTDVLGDWGNASFTIGNSLCEVNDNNEIISINPEGYIKAEGTVENWENSEWVKCFLSYIMSQFLYVNNKYYTKSGWVNMGYEVVRSNGYAGYWTGRINISSPNSDDPNAIRYKKALNFTILSGQVIQYGVCVQFEFTNVDVGELTNYVSCPFGVKVGDTGNYIRKIYKVDYGNLKYNINKLT